MADSSPALQQALSSFKTAQDTVSGSLQTPEMRAAQSGADTASDKAQEAAGRAAQAQDDYGASLGSQKAPEAPKTPDLEAPPTAPPSDPMKVFGKFMPVMAMLGGLLIKGHAMGAMEAATAAGQAAKDNDAEALKKAHDAWTDKTDQALKQYNLQRDAYDDALKTMQTNMQLGLAKAQSAAAAAGDYQMMSQIAQGKVQNIYAMRQTIDNAAKNIIDMKNHVDDVNLKRQEVGIEAQRVANEAKFHAAEIGIDKEKADAYVEKMKAAAMSATSPAQKEMLQSVMHDADRTAALKTISGLQQRQGAIAYIGHALATPDAQGNVHLDPGQASMLFDSHVWIASGKSPTRNQQHVLDSAIPVTEKAQAMGQQLDPNGNVLIPNSVAKQLFKSYYEISKGEMTSAMTTLANNRQELAKLGLDYNVASPSGYDAPFKPSPSIIGAIKQAAQEGDVSSIRAFGARYGDQALRDLGIAPPDEQQSQMPMSPPQ